ncbi:MAG: very short patch repair endonuclease [Chloroflexi bacterium]|nr:very short patch repair endonuclease [Chloroflexota bacterium]
MLLRRSLHALGARYRLRRPVGPRLTADVVFLGSRVAVFVDGCFWHGCPVHGRKTFQGPNRERWLVKMASNRERDARATATAESSGWRVLRLWECEIVADPGRSAQRVLDAVRQPTHGRYRRGSRALPPDAPQAPGYQRLEMRSQTAETPGDYTVSQPTTGANPRHETDIQPSHREPAQSAQDNQSVPPPERAVAGVGEAVRHLHEGA